MFVVRIIFDNFWAPLFLLHSFLFMLRRRLHQKQSPKVTRFSRISGQCCGPLHRQFSRRWDSAGLRDSRRSGSKETNRELAGGNVHLVTTMENWEKHTSEAKKEDKIVVVNFTASWCAPCRQIAPAYRELADRYPALVFLAIDVDELAEFCSKWDIKATPTFFILRSGRQLDKLVGANKLELQKKVEAVVE